MDRQIVYPGQIPLETDLLNTNRFAMTGLAKLAAAILGENTCLFGLACTPSTSASMAVKVGEGQIYSLQSIDGAAYSSLPADISNRVLKQGLLMAPVTFPLRVPTSAGQSINYLIQVAYNDVDSGPTVLPYYNAANPSVAFSGPENSGGEQSTVRSGVCHLSIKASIPAATGSQLTPAPDAGCTPAWVITVSYGMSSVNSEDIRPADGAPFLPAAGLINAIQKGTLTYGEDMGSENHYRITCNPAISHVIDGMRLRFRAKNANTGPSFVAAGHLPEVHVLTLNHEQMQAGDINQGQVAEVEWNSILNAWILCSLPTSYSRCESDNRYYSLDGGKIGGDVDVQGSLTVEKLLKVGRAGLNVEGDISGPKWGGSLFSWLEQQKPNMDKSTASSFVWEEPVSKLIIQGGHFPSGGGEIIFPVPFPQRCIVVNITQSAKKGESRDNAYVQDVAVDKFRINAGKGETAFYWLAIGC